MRKASKILALLLAITIPFLAWIIFRGQANLLPATTPTSPYADFTVHIPQKALLKNYISVSAEAAPGTTCSLTYIPPSGESLQMDATADSTGLCEWRWKIEESHGAGDARLVFTIDGSSDTHFIQIFKEF